VRRIFGNAHAKPRGHDKGNAARLPQFERGAGVAVYESLLDGSFGWHPGLKHLLKSAEQHSKPLAHRLFRRCLYRTASHEGKTRLVPIDHAPAKIAEARIEPNDAR